ncbi:MAG: CHAP domain-containing protein [candidate division SR1 bacterium]|nr:CHAP domain-containing protein [candidate division SR1 bacterium]
MRPYNTFREKRIGKRVDYDGVYGYQCVDFAKFYIDTCLGLGRVGRLGNAKDTPNAPFFADWEKIWGTNDLMQGDIIVKTRGKYGHIAIVDRIANGMIYVLEQNGSGKNSGSGEGENAIRLKGYPFDFYDMVLRCPKIFENLQEERRFIEEKLLERQEAVRADPESNLLKAKLISTQDYQNSIRYIKK